MPLASTLLGDLTEGFRLPIARRGMFSQDDFFSGFRNDYGRAVGDVLDRWGSRSSKADRFASYRRLRERDPSEDSLAATISEKPEVYVIVLDMNEYASGHITVETIGLSAVVEGKSGHGSYRRQFPLPQNTVIDGVVADMSDENILTITAPRKGKGVSIRMDSRDDTAKVDQRSTCTSTANDAASTQESGVDISSVEAQIIPTEVNASQTTSASTIQERVIPTFKEGTARNTTTESVKTEEVASSTRRGSKSRVIPLNIEGETTASETMVSQGSTTTSASAQTETTSETVSSPERLVPTVTESGAADATQAKMTQTTTSTTTSARGRVLPIKKRGRFFQDSTFERVWDDFESVMDDLVARRGSRAGLEKDRFQSYRNLRQCVQQDDNQAWNVTKDNGEYKIVVDVKEFVDDHLDVKAEQGAIVVTGKKGTVSFERRFSIPGLSQPDKVAAALSADGVLTITAPK